MADGDRASVDLRLAIACSTFLQAVDWTRIAPTNTSNVESAGHQDWGP